MGQIADRIEKNVWNFYKLPSDVEIKRVPAIALLSPNRMDVMARYLFVRHRSFGWGVGWGTSVYRHFLETYNSNFYDGDGTKSSFNHYLRSFSALADSVSTVGWDLDAGLIPHVGDTVVDGAHRLATALYHEVEVDSVELSGPQQAMSALHLLKAGMSPMIVDQLVNEYLKLDKDTYAALLFPSAEPQKLEAIEKIALLSTIVHSKEILLTDQGRRNLIELLYGHEPWWAAKHLEDFVKLRFPKGGPVTVVFFKSPVGSRPVKEAAREAFTQLHYVHSNDTHEETVWIGDILLNPNGIQYLNIRPTRQPKRFLELLSSYEDKISGSPSRDQYCIDSGGVLAAFGLRDCSDLDYITPELRTPRLEGDESISWHNEEYMVSPVPVDELIANPSHHFVYKGVKYMALDTVLFFKRKRGAAKDVEDCRLILEAKYRISARDQLAVILKDRRRRLKDFSDSFPRRSADILRSCLPVFLFGPLRSLYRRYKKISDD